MIGDPCARCGHVAMRVGKLNGVGHFPDPDGRCVTKGCECPSWLEALGPDEERFLQAMTAAVVVFCQKLHPDAKNVKDGFATPEEMIRFAKHINMMALRVLRDELGRIPP